MLCNSLEPGGLGLSLNMAKKGEEEKQEKETVSTHVQLQNEFGGDDVTLGFVVEGEETKFEMSFKSGQTFEWVKHKVALQLEVHYADLSLFFKEKPIPEPFCLVDLGVKTSDIVTVHIKEGAERGLEKAAKEIHEEIVLSGGLPKEEEEEEDM